MESIGLRHRSRGASIEVDSLETSSDSTPNLTPSSSRAANEGDREPSHWRHLLFEASQRIVQFAKNPLSRLTAEEEREFNILHAYDRIRNKTVDDYSEGLPQLAQLMASDKVFAHYRKFERLASRMLLDRQQALFELDKKIHELDTADEKDGILRHRLFGYKDYGGWNDEKDRLIDEALVKYMEYADLLLKHAQVGTLPKTTERNHKQLLNFIMNNSTLGVGQYDFIFENDDFVSPGKPPEKDSRFEDFVEYLLSKWPGVWPWSYLRVLLGANDEKRKFKIAYLYKCSPDRVAALANTLVILLTVAGIGIPVLLFFLRPMNRQIMSTLAIGFIFVFAIAVAGLVGARPSDVMFGTVAYSAVIIMFLNSLYQASVGA